jgi:hypothetical protein
MINFSALMKRLSAPRAQPSQACVEILETIQRTGPLAENDPYLLAREAAVDEGLRLDLLSEGGGWSWSISLTLRGQALVAQTTKAGPERSRRMESRGRPAQT